MPKYYPVNLLLENKKCVVLGAGKVAQRKVRRLLECGAKILVIAPEATPILEKLAQKKKIILKKRKAVLADLSGAYLVTAATDDRKLNSAASLYCRRKNILVNVADSLKDCNFILPSVLRRGNLTVSVSTGGRNPALAKKIRKKLSRYI